MTDHENLALVADIGGTNARFALADIHSGMPRLFRQETLPTADYASLPHRKGFPEGHAPIVRELVIPVFRGESIVAILGIGAWLFTRDQPDPGMMDLSINKELPKVSEKEMDEFLSGMPDISIPEPIVGTGNPGEAEEMMRDIDEEGLKDFLADQPEITPLNLN